MPDFNQTWNMSTNFNENIATNFTKILTCEMSYFMRTDGETDWRADGHDEASCSFSPHILEKKAPRKTAASIVIIGSKLPGFLPRRSGLLLLFSTPHCSLRAYCAIWVNRSNFRHQASPRVSPRDNTQRRKVELWARNVR